MANKMHNKSITKRGRVLFEQKLLMHAEVYLNIKIHVSPVEELTVVYFHECIYNNSITNENNLKF